MKIIERNSHQYDYDDPRYAEREEDDRYYAERRYGRRMSEDEYKAWKCGYHEGFGEAMRKVEDDAMYGMRQDGMGMRREDTGMEMRGERRGRDSRGRYM